MPIDLDFHQIPAHIGQIANRHSSFAYRQRVQDRIRIRFGAVLEQCEVNDCTPSYAQAVEMKKRYQDGQLTAENISEILSREKANQRETVKIPTEKLRKYAPNADAKQLEDFILKACEHYRKFLIRQHDVR